MQIPNYVAALNSGGSAFLVQASVGGSSAFFCNDDMAASFVSAHEAEAIYGASSSDPDSVMRRLIVQQDRPKYLKAMTDLIVRHHELIGETSLIAHVNARRGPPVLSLVQLRSSFHGDSVVFGVKFIPMPSSDYLPPAAPVLAPSMRPYSSMQPMGMPSIPLGMGPLGGFGWRDDARNPFDMAAMSQAMSAGQKRKDEHPLAAGKRHFPHFAPDYSSYLGGPRPGGMMRADLPFDTPDILDAFEPGFEAPFEGQVDPALASFAMGFFS